MKITKEIIPLIEKALDIKLYDEQKIYLLNEKYTRWKGGRRTGHTLAHCIKLALADGEDKVIFDDFGYKKAILKGSDPIYIKKMEYYSDYGDGSVRYARGYYRRMFLDIWERLKAAGLPVRELKF